MKTNQPPLNLTEDQLLEYYKCAESPVYFAKNYVWIMENETSTVLPFNPLPYRIKILKYLKAGKNLLGHKSRRVGWSWTVSTFAAWLINFHPGVNILFLSYKEDEAIELLGKVKFILKNLAKHDSQFHEDATPADWMRGHIEVDNQKTFSIGYHDDNGNVTRVSSVNSLPTTEKTGAGRGSTMIFIDEFGLIKPNDELTWTAIKPTVARGGQWVACSCVTEDTIIFTNNGIETVGDYIDPLLPVGEFGEVEEFKIYGKDGLKTCDVTYNSGLQPTRKITTRYGYRLECTLIHPILVNRDGNIDWVRCADIQVGDWIPIERGMDCWGNETSLEDCKPTYREDYWYRGNKWECPDNMTEDLAYLLGMIVGDGYIDIASSRNNRINIATVDVQTIDWLCDRSKSGLSFSLQKDGQHVIASSKPFVDFCKLYGMPIGIKAPDKFIPARILRSPKNIVRAFMQGLFDSDGCATKRGDVSFTTTSEKLARQVQMILLNFDITSSLYKGKPGISERAIGRHPAWTLYVYSDSRIFFEKIGFRLLRKQDRRVIVDSRDESIKNIIPFATRLIRPIRSGLPRLLGNPELSKVRRDLTDKILWKERSNLSYHSAVKILEYYEQAADREAYKELRSLVDRNYFWVQIESVEESENYTYDFHIPDGHSFVSNGLISHNTPRGVGGVHHRLVMQAQRGDNKTYEYMETHWSETEITPEQYQAAIEGMGEQEIAQEWELDFAQSGDPAFNATHVTACYKPLEDFPDIKEMLDTYEKVEGTYYSGVDSAMGKAHKASNLKDYNSWISLTSNGIMAYAYHSKESLAKWAGHTIRQEGDYDTEVTGTVTKLHHRYPGPCTIEENGPGMTVIGRHQVPNDAVSMVYPLTVNQMVKQRLIQNLELAIEGHKIIITDLFTYQCLLVYQRGITGGGLPSWSAPMGYNDDPVMALAMAWDSLRRSNAYAVDFGDPMLARRTTKTLEQIEQINHQNASWGPMLSTHPNQFVVDPYGRSQFEEMPEELEMLIPDLETMKDLNLEPEKFESFYEKPIRNRLL